MIMARRQPTTLFLDIGGVMLTNGWDRRSRKRAEKQFSLEAEHEEIAERHEAYFDVYELGRLSLDGYIERVYFFRHRPFTAEDFKAFMFEQSQPLPQMLDFLRQLKARYNLRTIAVSNEGRELAVYRVKKYKLGDFIDSFLVSSFVHMRKPDPQIYTLALEIAQVPAGEVVYLEDRGLSVEAAQHMGIPSILHRGHASTREALARLGLSLESGGPKRAAGKQADAGSKGAGRQTTGRRGGR